MRVWLVILMMLLAPLLAQAKVYKWKDSKGVTHYSDQPHQGSKEMQLPEPQRFSPLPSVEEPAVKGDGSGPAAAPYKYQSVSIATPQREATIRNNDGSLDIAVDFAPGEMLMPGHRIMAIIDGQTFGDLEVQPVFSLEGILRGSHSLSVRIEDKHGNILGESETITFHMHRWRVRQSPLVPIVPKG